MIAEMNIGIDEVLAVVGALYIVARVIVMITPTKQDDKVMDKVSTWLVILKTVTGLSLNQGVKKYGPK